MVGNVGKGCMGGGGGVKEGKSGGGGEGGGHYTEEEEGGGRFRVNPERLAAVGATERWGVYVYIFMRWPGSVRVSRIVTMILQPTRRICSSEGRIRLTVP